MRKKVLLVALLVLAMTAPAFADLELGVSWTPIPAEDASSEEEFESITGFHLGYQWWGIFYATWDSLVMPPRIMYGLTDKKRPGFLNMFDAGIRLRLGPIIMYTTAGINHVYLYKQDQIGNYDPDLGVNLRAGAGLKFGWWGANVSGTAVFADFEQMTQRLAALADERTAEIAAEKLLENLIPSINVTLYF